MVSQISAFVEELLRRPSASSQAQIDSWEEERVVCPHTKELEQLQNAPKLDSARRSFTTLIPSA